MKSRHLLICSFSLNTVLAVSAVYFWNRHGEESSERRVCAILSDKSRAAAAASPNPFSWTPVPLADRGVENVEVQSETVRELPSTENRPAVPSPHAATSAQYSRTTTPVTSTYSSPSGQVAYNAGGEDGRGEAAASAVGNSSAARDPQPQSPRPAVPLAFQAANFTVTPAENSAPSAAAVAEADMTSIAQAQDEFVKQLGGANQNPSDPTYARKWTKAQQIADDLLRASLGDDRFTQYQLDLARQGK